MPQAGSSTRVVQSLRWKSLNGPQSALAVVRRLQRMRMGQRLLPIGAQRLNDRRDHQPLDIGARRVVGAESGALPLVQRALQQRAEDGGLDIAPVALGSDPELMDIVLLQRERPAVS